MCRICLLILFFLSLISSYAQNSKVDSSLFLRKSITGKISPKSVVHNGKGVFFAQNMMYRHTVTVYNRAFELVETIKDQVKLSEYGFNEYKSSVKGGPVECAFSHNGQYAWVSNYSMSGGGDGKFSNPGCDNCSSSSKYDSSFVYKIDAVTKKILSVIKVGAVPKYIACSPDNQKVIVTNWSSGDVSIVDVALNKEVKRIKVGTFPRGIVIDSKSQFSYVTVMGSTKIAKINLQSYETSFYQDIGKGPRHLCISPDDDFLYLTLNTENKLAKIDLKTKKVEKVKVGHQPRSMTISADGLFLYVVNYNDNTFSKIRTSDLKTVAVSPTKKKPIGITYDDDLKQVWVACYSGYIQVFDDSLIKSKITYDTELDKESLALVSTLSDASVANLSQIVDSSAAITNDTLELALVDKAEKKRAFVALSKTYEVPTKKFDLNKFKKAEVIVEEPKVVVKETFSTNVLDAEMKCLVIVGGFGEANNADKKVKQLAKQSINASKLYNAQKDLTYVFVYSSNSKVDAQNWIANQLPSEIESWVLVK